jgi:hypothetical protein
MDTGWMLRTGIGGWEESGRGLRGFGRESSAMDGPAGEKLKGWYWYPAPNLDRALAPSWVGRFCWLTQELVTRLNFGSASAQVAPPLLPLLTLLLTFCPGAAQGPQSRFTHTQSRLWALAIIGEPCLACSCRSFEFFINSTRRSGGSVWDLWGNSVLNPHAWCIWTHMLYLFF